MIVNSQDKGKNHKLKMMIAKYSLEKNIENSRKNKINPSFEEKILTGLTKPDLFCNFATEQK